MPKFTTFLSKIGLIELLPTKSVEYIENLTKQMIQLRKDNPQNVKIFSTTKITL